MNRGKSGMATSGYRTSIGSGRSPYSCQYEDLQGGHLVIQIVKARCEMALRTTETAETPKIAILHGNRPGDRTSIGSEPLSGHPTAFDDAWGGHF